MSFNNVAQVLRALGVLDQVVDTVDPLGSDIGGLRADKLVRKRAMTTVEVLVEELPPVA